MNCITNNNKCQMSIYDLLNNEQNMQNSKHDNFLKIPSNLDRFINTSTDIVTSDNGRKIYRFFGYVELSDNDYICECCRSKMHKHDSSEIKIKHIPIGGYYSCLIIKRYRLKCPKCNVTKLQEIPFMEENHYITIAVKNYIEDLLSTNKFTNKEIAFLTGVNRNTVKDIDKKRLIKKYTINGEGKELIKPEVQATYLGIDEFKLHNGYKYATHIIDYDNGHILWIAKGKN